MNLATETSKFHSTQEDKLNAHVLGVGSSYLRARFSTTSIAVSLSLRHLFALYHLSQRTGIPIHPHNTHTRLPHSLTPF